MLTVVTADPDDVDALKEVQLVSGAREVKLVRRAPGRRAGRSSSRRTRGDIHAFDMLDRQAHMQFHALPGLIDRAIELDDGSPAAAEPAVRGRERILGEDDLARTPSPAAARTLSAPPPPAQRKPPPPPAAAPPPLPKKAPAAAPAAPPAGGAPPR